MPHRHLRLRTQKPPANRKLRRKRNDQNYNGSDADVMLGDKRARATFPRRRPNAKTLEPTASLWSSPPNACCRSWTRIARCTEAIQQNLMRWWATYCCRISIPNTRPGWSWDKRWRTASEDQRKRFVDAFYHSLLRNYGAALIDFTADRFVILPYKGDPGDTTATVRTEVKRESGAKVPVNFSLRKTAEGWKAWDVVIDGISYVKSFPHRFCRRDPAERLGRRDQPIGNRGQGRTQWRRGGQPLKTSAGLTANSRLSKTSGHASTASCTSRRSLHCCSRALRQSAAAMPRSLIWPGISDSDSAGLALLIEWLSVAKAASRGLSMKTYRLNCISSRA